MVCDNYVSKKVVEELLSAKNEYINWLKEEVKYLRQEIEHLLGIVGKNKKIIGK